MNDKITPFADNEVATTAVFNQRIEQMNNVVSDCTADIKNNADRIQFLWDALFCEITTNPFTFKFDKLDGITLLSGVWNQAEQHLEC